MYVWFWGELESGQQIQVVFRMPWSIVENGFERNGDWFNEHFMSGAQIPDGGRDFLYSANSQMRFKVLSASEEKIRFAFSGRYLDADKGQYLRVNPVELTAVRQ